MKILTKWEKATNELANAFRRKYFDQIGSDYYWIADEIGGTYHINDYFFSLRDMVDFLRYKYSEKDMFDYYDYELELEKYNMLNKNKKKKIVVNIENWKKLRHIK